MLRYIVMNQKSRTPERMYETLGEAIGGAVKLIDAGDDATIIDSQGSGAIEVGRFDLLEAEGHVLRSLGSETFDRPVPLDVVLNAARKRQKEHRVVYHWDISTSDIR